MFNVFANQNASDKVAVKIRHDTDTIYVGADVFEVSGKRFELAKPFAYKIVSSGKRRTVLGFVTSTPKGGASIVVHEIEAPDLPPPEHPAFTEKQIAAFKRAGRPVPKGKKYPSTGQPARALSVAEAFAELYPGQQPPADGALGKRSMLSTTKEGYVPRFCLFRVIVPEGPINLDQLSIDVWTNIESWRRAEERRQDERVMRERQEKAQAFIADLKKRAEERQEKARHHKQTLTETHAEADTARRASLRKKEVPS